MTTPQALHHALLRPCILHILRAAGYHSTRPSVLDTLTDLAARYISQLASLTAEYAELNHDEHFDISIEDFRMAMEDCGALIPRLCLEDEDYQKEEDTRGVDGFIEWAKGSANKEIRRIALDGGEADKEDYLTALKKKSSKAEDDSRYQGTVLGKTAPARRVKIEGADLTSLQDWAERMRKRNELSTSNSPAYSSALSSVQEHDMEGVELS